MFAWEKENPALSLRVRQDRSDHPDQTVDSGHGPRLFSLSEPAASRPRLKFVTIPYTAAQQLQ